MKQPTPAPLALRQMPAGAEPLRGCQWPIFLSPAARTIRMLTMGQPIDAQIGWLLKMFSQRQTYRCFPPPIGRIRSRWI